MILLKYSRTLQPTLGSAGLQTREGSSRQSAKAPSGKVCKSHSWAPPWHKTPAEEETRDCQLIPPVHLEGLVLIPPVHLGGLLAGSNLYPPPGNRDLLALSLGPSAQTSTI